MKRWFAFALLFASCATTEAGLHSEAVYQLEICVNSALEPYAARASCLGDVLAYCDRVKIRCNAEQLWQTAQFNFDLGPPP